jgi:L-iditol 2-dehydrogenase
MESKIMKMKAAVVEKPNKIVVKDVNVPVCEHDEVLIKIHRACICNATDTEIFRGQFPFSSSPPYPHILGHECSGEIVKVDKSVSDYKIGDRISFWGKMEGAFAEFITLKPSQAAIAKLSDKVSYDEGVMMELVIGTMRGIYSAQIRPGDKVAVLGQGPAGLLFAQEAKIFGASMVIGLDLNDFRLKKSKELGTDLVFNTSGLEKEEIVKEIGESVGKFDIVIEAMGNDLSASGEGINLAIDLLKSAGRLTLFGRSTENLRVNVSNLSLKRIETTGVFAPMDRLQVLAETVEKLIASGQLKVKPLITHHVKLTEVEKGLEMCEKYPNTSIKIVIDVR